MGSLDSKSREKIILLFKEVAKKCTGVELSDLKQGNEKNLETAKEETLKEAEKLEKSNHTEVAGHTHHQKDAKHGNHGLKMGMKTVKKIGKKTLKIAKGTIRAVVNLTIGLWFVVFLPLCFGVGLVLNLSALLLGIVASMVARNLKPLIALGVGAKVASMACIMMPLGAYALSEKYVFAEKTANDAYFDNEQKKEIDKMKKLGKTYSGKAFRPRPEQF